MIALFFFFGVRGVSVVENYFSHDGIKMIVSGDYSPHWVMGRLAYEGYAAESYQKNNVVEKAEATLKPLGLTSGPALRANVYPPTMLLFLKPLGAFDFVTSYRVFIAIGVCLFTLMLCIWKIDGVLIVSLLLSPGLWFSLRTGQNGLIIAALIGLGFALSRNRPFLSGVCFGLCCIKPQFGLYLPLVLILDHRWKVFGAAAVTCVSVSILSYLFCGGWETWQAFIDNAPQSAQNIMQTAILYPRLWSVYGGFRVLGASFQWAEIFQLISAITACFALVVICMRSRDVAIRMAATVCATFASLPVVYDYDTAQLMLVWILVFWLPNKSRWILGLVIPLLVVMTALLTYYGLLTDVNAFPLIPACVWVMLLTLVKISGQLSVQEKSDTNHL